MKLMIGIMIAMGILGIVFLYCALRLGKEWNCMTCKYKDWDVHGDPCRECEDCQLHEDEDRRGMAEDAK